MITQVAQSYFLSAHDPFTPLTTLLLAASLNLMGDIWLVAGLGWGISGAAAATAAAQVRCSNANYLTSDDCLLPRCFDLFAFCRLYLRLSVSFLFIDTDCNSPCLGEGTS